MTTLQELQLDEEQRIEDIKQGRDDAISGKPASEGSDEYLFAYADEHLSAALNLLGGEK